VRRVAIQTVRDLVFRGAFVVIAAGLAHASSPTSTQPRIGPTPDWVALHDFPRLSDAEIASRSGSSYILLFDYQEDLASNSSYTHLAIKILSYEGVQQLSEFSVDHDPSYQTLTLHQVRLHRGDKVIERLRVDPIQTIQREPNAESFLYDGTLTSSIHLSDVRVGDIIEYSYSRRGQHPAYQGHTFGELPLDSSVPVELVLVRVRVPENRTVAFRYVNMDVTPEVTHEADQTVYEWRRERLKELVYDNNVPGWYLAYAAIRFTDYENWREMVQWALPLFEVSATEKTRLREVTREVLTFSDQPSSVLEAIHFVQNEIRYLALAHGMSAYRPHPPTQVWKQRYGDCKDKALLLSTLLNELGADAHPMLVNTAGLPSADDFAVAPGAFDHCVVAFRYHDRMYFVDPTASYQGGALDHLYFPNYKFGLIVAPESEGLTPLPEAATGRTSVTEHFQLDRAGGGTLSVATEFHGSDADMARLMFATNDLASIQKQYLSYYAALYPDITPEGDITYSDDYRDTDNVIVVVESYKISHVWLRDEADTSATYVKFFPLQMDNMTLWNSTPNRTMPYQVGRVDYRHEYLIDPPVRMPVVPVDVHITGNAFDYRKKVTLQGDQISVVHEYQRAQSYIDAGAVGDFVAKHDRIRANLSYILVRSPPGARGISWALLIIVLVFAAGTIWAAVRTYQEFDPEPRLPGSAYGAATAGLRGWLILPAIGLVLAPLQALSVVPDLIYCFDARVSEGFGAGLTALIGFEAASCAVGAVLWVLLIVSFFKRRSSVTLLFVVYVGAQLVYLVVNAILAEELMPESLGSVETGLVPSDPIWLIAFGAIWVPYFLVSDRVKRTFVVRGPQYRPPAVPQSGYLDVPPAARTEDESRADQLEHLAGARLQVGMPPREVAAWLTEQGLSPSMAVAVVNVLLARGEGKAGRRTTTPALPDGPIEADTNDAELRDEAPSQPMHAAARIGLFGLVLLMVILGIIRC
jgi:transglutaminase-like putative cysteine protease